MVPPNEFWLHLQRLSQAYDAEGPTPAARVENILTQFEEMAPAARRQVLGELAQLTTTLAELYPQALTAGSKPHRDRPALKQDAG